MNKIKTAKIDKPSKELVTLDVLINISAYLNLADSYIQTHLTNKEVMELGLTIDKMKEEMDKLKEYYEYYL